MKYFIKCRGGYHHKDEAIDLAETLYDIFDLGGSINFYMFHGLTHFEQRDHIVLRRH